MNNESKSNDNTINRNTHFRFSRSVISHEFQEKIEAQHPNNVQMFC